MPRYFFDLEDHERDRDDSGVDLSNAEAARVEAIVFAGQYLSDNPGLLWDGSRFVVHVRDEDDHRLFSIEINAKEIDN